MKTSLRDLEIVGAAHFEAHFLFRRRLTTLQQLFIPVLTTLITYLADNRGHIALPVGGGRSTDAICGTYKLADMPTVLCVQYGTF